MIARVLSAIGLAPRKSGLDWRPVSSAEMRAGRYTIIDDPHDPEVRVLVDGKPLATGFGSRERSAGMVRA